MTGWELALLYVAWLIGGGSPGPATLALASTGMARGRKTALALALGILVASAAWAVAAAAGFGAAMLANAWLADLLRYVGAAYILWLAVKSIHSAMKPGAPKLAQAMPQEPRKAFWGGVMLHATNPKAILSWGAVYAIAVPPGSGIEALVAVGAFLFTGSILIFVGYALLFSTETAMRRYAAARRWFEAIFGVLFGGAAIGVLSART
ncbi:MAG: LysE family translocator [Pseudomonadota bacterium]